MAMLPSTAVRLTQPNRFSALPKRRDAGYEIGFVQHCACNHSKTFLAPVLALVLVESLMCSHACMARAASGVFPFGASHVWNSATRLMNSERGFVVLTSKARAFSARLLHAMWTLEAMNQLRPLRNCARLQRLRVRVEGTPTAV
jgi:hypothetical protein